MDWLKNVHFYRKVPRDLTEATLAGGTISLLSSIVMAYLFVTNFSSYLSVDTKTAIVLDASTEKKLQINFNVTIHHLPCRFASLDIVDVMGTHLQNVSANIVKTRIDSKGGLIGAHKGVALQSAQEVKHAESRMLAAGLTPPQVSPELQQQSFLDAVKQKQLVLVNFYAPWCPWSRRLQPVWEEAYHNVLGSAHAKDVMMAKADCTAGGQELCRNQHVHAFPTVRVYRRHNPHSHESYIGDRTHEALEAFIANNVHDADEAEAVVEQQSEVGAVDGEGCIVRGVVLVNRVPGNFHISAHSKSHSFQAGKLNMSHRVDAMSFGKILSPAQLRLLPPEVKAGYSGLSGSAHVAAGQNTTIEHYLKVVHTSYALSSTRSLDTYQYTVNHNNYQDGTGLPAAVFSYDISPMQVMVSEERESFAAFLTQICAIIGGVFTVTGLIDSIVYHGGITFQQKLEIGKGI
mmetsp:Transcript_24549/g.60887  ORF Transcript_24549/g.60887 Transcript_24549/m.60887 type:complete len:460 (-) Transcript_24549:417-1796(-)